MWKTYWAKTMTSVVGLWMNAKDKVLIYNMLAVAQYMAIAKALKRLPNANPRLPMPGANTYLIDMLFKRPTLVLFRDLDISVYMANGSMSKGVELMPYINGGNRHVKKAVSQYGKMVTKSKEIGYGLVMYVNCIGILFNRFMGQAYGMWDQD